MSKGSPSAESNLECAVDTLRNLVLQLSDSPAYSPETVMPIVRAVAEAEMYIKWAEKCHQAELEDAARAKTGDVK